MQNRVKFSLDVNVFGDVALDESEFPGFIESAEIAEPARDEVVNAHDLMALGDEIAG
jgi:hypothetical protein